MLSICTTHADSGGALFTLEESAPCRTLTLPEEFGCREVTTVPFLTHHPKHLRRYLA